MGTTTTRSTVRLRKQAGGPEEVGEMTAPKGTGGAAEDGAHHGGQQGAWPRSGTRGRAPRPLRRRLRPLRRARPLP
jgi:hypothetical protein